jgi:hypothetical protein
VQQPVLFRHDPPLLGELTLPARKRRFARGQFGLSGIEERFAPRHRFQPAVGLVACLTRARIVSRKQGERRRHHRQGRRG